MKSLTLAALTMGCALSIVTATNASATVETFDWALTGLSPSLGYAPLQGGGTLLDLEFLTDDVGHRVAASDTTPATRERHSPSKRGLTN